MYCYIYDDFVQDRKHEKELSAIEHRITDLGLQGKIIRLALFRDPESMIRKEIERGVKTVVVVGNDQTVHKIANAVVDGGAVLGLIPVGTPNVFARILGIPKGVQAADVLSRRIIEEMDVGRVNDHRFFTGVSFPSVKTVVRAGKAFDMVTMQQGAVQVKNLAIEPPKDASELSDPIDGALDVEITTYAHRLFRKVPNLTHIPLSTFDVITKEPVTAHVDGVPVHGNEFHFETEAGVLQVIVSRERMFEQA